MVNTASMKFKPGSWEEMIYDVYVGIYVGTSHSLYFLSKRFTQLILLPPLHAMGGGKRLDDFFDRQKSFPIKDGETPSLKVIGCGYGRTGTYSLSLALDQLGIPSLHTQHLYENDVIFNMLTNKIFFPSIQTGSATLGTPDLQLIANEGFQATTDLPLALYFEQILEAYPNCKFILTKRENSQVWYKSWNKLTESITKPTHYGSFITGNSLKYYTRWLYSIINKDNRFLTAPLDELQELQNKTQSIISYEEHNTMVKQIIPPSQLLEYNVKQGWEPLCKFLEIKDCPLDVDFPKSNSALSLQVQGLFAMIGPIILMFLITIICVFRPRGVATKVKRDNNNTNTNRQRQERRVVTTNTNGSRNRNNNTNITPPPITNKTAATIANKKKKETEEAIIKEATTTTKKEN